MTFTLPDPHPHMSYTQTGPLGRIHFTREETLNALSYPMMKTLDQLTLAWENDPSISCVLVTGQGARAFCAGGDLRSVHKAQLAKDYAFLEELFRREYTFNVRLQAFSKPYVSLLHGFTMGGGVGASVHGSHRVVCENSVLAMPETNIGYFPDVGAHAFLNKCPGAIGLYLGLTGLYISGADALYIGLATHFAPHSTYADIQEAFLKKTPVSPVEVDALLCLYAQAPPVSPLQQQQPFIDTHFSKNSLEEIFLSLETANDSFAKETLEVLSKRCPLSLHTTFEYLTRARRLSFPDAMTLEFQLSQHFVKTHDFQEGIRAAVVDKDRNPTWQHPSWRDVPKDLVQSYFEAPVLGIKALLATDKKNV
ncbi:MAG: enoyl-CoA hydratase/isomerase family protein [Alphaproteobacteria bacterium]|nr:enoyl-CoA hydratase/isomerase family protein [Alphaproteobacteria bacterium]